MSQSLRSAMNCAGFSGQVSVLYDFMGYWRHPGRVSLSRHLASLADKYIDLNVIRVGGNRFKEPDEQAIDTGLQALRDIYATAGIGVRRVEKYEISIAAAEGRDSLDSYDEARALTRAWTVPNDAMDLFVVRLFYGFHAGLSAIGGSCNKNSKSTNGSIVALIGFNELGEVNDNRPTIGRTMAHELGHYLGLDHVPNAANLLCGGEGSRCDKNKFELNGEQILTMRAHCFVSDGCP